MSLDVRYNKTFLKELARLPEVQRTKVEQFIFEDIQKIKTPGAIPNLKKIKGFKNYYRIRFGHYRAGLQIKRNKVIFERLLHRKDIYKYYP